MFEYRPDPKSHPNDYIAALAAYLAAPPAFLEQLPPGLIEDEA